MYRDGFNDPLSGLVMGETAEDLAKRYEIARDEQDEYALRSQQRAAAAIDAGRFENEIVPLELKDRKGNVTPFARDEHARADTSIESLASLLRCSQKRELSRRATRQASLTARRPWS